MVELIWIVEFFRTVLSGEPLQPLMEKPGFFQTMIWVAAIVPSTIIALGIGLHDWSETPLGRWLGAKPKEDVAPRSTAEIDHILHRHTTDLRQRRRLWRR